MYVVTLSSENVETDRSTIRTRLTAEKIAERRKRASSPRVYMDGSLPGGQSVSSSQPR